MADTPTASGTESTNGAPGTDPNSGSATPVATPDPATHQETPPDNNGEQVTLSQKDYQNLISQRDRNHQQGNDQVQELSATVAELAKNADIDSVSKKYPDVPRDLLETAGDPEQLEALGKTFQAKADELKNKASQDLENVGDIPASTDDLAAELKSLEGTGNLERALEIKGILGRRRSK